MAAGMDDRGGESGPASSWTSSRSRIGSMNLPYGRQPAASPRRGVTGIATWAASPVMQRVLHGQ